MVNRAPMGERRILTRRLLARRALHTARRDRKIRPSRGLRVPLPPREGGGEKLPLSLGEGGGEGYA